ncbi:MAG TPA: hypothetical protein VGN57_14570 [Pirellulaceae bacterium]|nr:hypothetical protein [Pirellulaceae bacterium]
MPSLRLCIALCLHLLTAPLVALAQPTTYPADLQDDRLPTSTIRTVPTHETTYRQEWTTEMVETPVRRWVPVPRQVTSMQLPAAPHPVTGTAPWLVNVPAVEWKLVEEKVRTPVTTSRIVPETRTVQKEIRMLAFEPGAKALARSTPVQPIPGANVVTGGDSPRVASAPNTTIPSTTIPSGVVPGQPPATPPSAGQFPVGGSSAFPPAPFGANPWVTPLQQVPSPTPWTAGTVGPNPQWGGLQRIDGDLPTGGLGAPGGLR